MRLLLTLLVAACSLGLLAPTANTTPPPDVSAIIAEAWRAWQQGDQSLVEERFKEALRQDPDNTRANLGLSFLYSLQRRYDRAWKAYDDAIDNLPDRAAYLYAAWVTPKFRQNFDNKSLSVHRIIPELAGGADSTGTLMAMANELLVSRSILADDLEAAREYGRAMNCMTDWMVIGPFDNVSGSGHDKVFPPEQEYRADGRYVGKNGIPTWWFKPAAMRLDNWVDFTRYFAQGTAVFYANTFVNSPAKQRVYFRIGTSGTFKAFVNDELVSESADEFDNDLDTYVTEIELQQGWNRVLVKCGFSEFSQCNFMLRITDAAGRALPGMQIGTEAQAYRSKPGIAPRAIENFAEGFFRRMIASNPDHLENYLLLADAYLRNDKWVDAELTLRKALALAPNSPLVYDRLIEAYRRGDKDDEIEQALDKMYSIDKNVPDALEHKFSQYIKTEDYDRAEEVVEHFARLLPESVELYAMRMGLYANKDLTEKLIELSNEAYERFPRNAGIVIAKATLVAQGERRIDDAIRIYQRFLDDGLDDDIMSAQAALYLSRSDLRNWRRIYDKLIAMSPASAGYYQYLAGVYFNMRDYPSAERELRRALEICPNSSVLWSKLGELHRNEHSDQEAMAAYRNALLYDPTDYDARATIRELEGRRSPFEQFSPTNIDSVIAYAHETSPDPDDGAIVVLDKARHVIYEKGASEAEHELVVKVLNGRGIDDWKEYVIPANTYNEELLIDKAVVVKQDGTETKADLDDNYVVFKSLEENDVIHLKWHTKNHYKGKLASHFFDTYYFNGYYPARHVSYELIAPKDFKFAHRTQNLEVAPEKADVPDGVLYRWAKNDIPAISYEYGMPTLDDVGSLLFISSIDDWQFLVDWYTDVATTKARSTYEITEQVRELLDGRENATDEEKMREIYNFITENIRYSSVAFRQGAYIPQKARDVLVNRIGDCKDVATLCIAMLREAGLKAHYVLVNTRDEGLNRNALPSVVFNHCIVAVESDGREKYLDLTANNYPIGSVPETDMDAFALVIRPGVKAPVYLPSGTIGRTVVSRSELKVGADNSLSGKTRTVGTGTVAASIRDYFRDQPRKEQEKKLLASLGGAFPNVKLNSFAFEDLDNLAPNASYSYEFEAPEFLSEAGSFRILKMPWTLAEESDRALSYEKREFPYDYWPGQDTLVEEVTLAIPDGYIPIELPNAVKLTSPVAEYSLGFTYAGGKLVARRQFINKKRVVETDEYAAFKTFHTAVVKEDSRLILLQKKGKK